MTGEEQGALGKLGVDQPPHKTVLGQQDEARTLGDLEANYIQGCLPSGPCGGPSRELGQGCDGFGGLRRKAPQVGAQAGQRLRWESLI